MRPWDGKDKSGKRQYSLDEIRAWNMQIDEKGSIYYETHEETPRIMIWCPASDLSRHLHRLEQIRAR